MRMQQFFDHNLKGEPAPDWMEKGVPFLRKGRDQLAPAASVAGTAPAAPPAGGAPAAAAGAPGEAGTAPPTGGTPR